MSENGKGDRPRPLSVPAETFAERWERTFGKKSEGEAMRAPALVREPEQEAA